MVSDFPAGAMAQEQLVAYLKHHRIGHAEDILWQWITAHPMPANAPLQRIDQLKTWLDAFRPLSPAVVNELRQQYRTPYKVAAEA